MLEHSIQPAHAQLDVAAFERIAHLARLPAPDWGDSKPAFGCLAQNARDLIACRRLLYGGCVHHHCASLARPVRPGSLDFLRPESGKILPGFMMPSASNASLTCCIA